MSKEIEQAKRIEELEKQVRVLMQITNGLQSQMNLKVSESAFTQAISSVRYKQRNP